MARKGGKYPTPEEIVAKYKKGIDYAKDKWADNAMEAAEKDLLVWYTAFAAKVYDTISKLPPKSTNKKDNLLNRSLPVIEAIGKASEAYRKARSTAVKTKSDEAREKAAALGIKLT